MLWALGILAAAIVGTLVLVIVRRPHTSRAAQRRKRYALNAADAPRIPLAADHAAIPAAAPIAEISAHEIRADGRRLADLVREDAQPNGAPPARSAGGRIVQTADGEAVITTPPFALRAQVVTTRLGRFVNGLGKRLPAWMIACPRVRLESLVIPTPPDGRDAADWSQWRRRVRMRAVDVVICDRRDWRPILAIMLKPAGKFSGADGSGGSVSALSIAGGRDRMIDEVLAHVGLTLIHAGGRLDEDWPLISPYIEQAILRSPSDEELHAADETRARPDPDAAVRLLKMDGEQGWLLE